MTLRHLRYDGHVLQLGLADPAPRLIAQVVRRIDVLGVEVRTVTRQERPLATTG